MKNQKASINPVVEIEGYNLRQLSSGLKINTINLRSCSSISNKLWTSAYLLSYIALSSISIRNNIHFPFLPGIKKQPGRHTGDVEKHQSKNPMV